MVPPDWYRFSSNGITEELLDFQNYIYEVAWGQSTFLRSAAIMDTTLRNLCESTLSSKKWLNEFVVHLKTIIQIAVSDAVGYEISNVSDCQHGPFKTCITVLREITNKSRTANYDPIILQPSYLKHTAKVFYSTNIFRILGTCAGMDGESFKDEMMGYVLPVQGRRLQQLISSLGGPEVSIEVLKEKRAFSSEIDSDTALEHEIGNVCPSAPFLTGCVVIRKVL